MADTSTSYMGLTLRNPLIVGSCGITKDIDGVRKCADAGAGAVVLKSIFEEQIREDFSTLDTSVTTATYHPEAFEYFRADLASRYGAHDYCKSIEAMKSSIDIPIIASINCFSSAAWNDFAHEIQGAGADALEFNISFPPLEQFERDQGEYVRKLADVLKKVTAELTIPIAVKLPPVGLYAHAIANAFASSGAKGLVMFNRFLVPQVDINSISISEEVNFSSSSESSLARRYVALMSRRLSCDLVASCGVNTSEDMLSMLLVGAKAVQVVSTIYKNSVKQIGEMVSGLEKWMDEKGFASIEDFRGKLAADPRDTANPFGRFQYIKTLGEAPSA